MMTKKLGTFVTLIVCVLTGRIRASDNGLAITPQMGWNNWNAFGCSTSSSLLLTTASQIKALGLLDLGYTYIVQDDCWSAGRNSTGYLQPDLTKFPNGIKSVADELHEMGFGMGIYSDAGTLTCGRYEGSLGYEKEDADLWASWGIDYVKYDNCYNEGQSGTPLITHARYKKMGDALNATGRPMLYSLCNWGEDQPWNWAQTLANSWRMTGDVQDTFDRPDKACPCEENEGLDCKLPGFKCSLMNIINKMPMISQKAGTGSWNDMDILEVGNGGMTDDEYVTHFSMWSILKSPLLMGNNFASLSPSTLSIFSNPAVLSLSQDPSSSSATQRWRYFINDTDEFGQGEIQLWTMGLSGGDTGVALVNAGNGSREMNATLRDIFWDDGPIGMSGLISQPWDVYDLWANRMPDDVAQELIDAATSYLSGNTSVNPNEVGKEYRYNATAYGGYAEGLSEGVEVLMGKKVGTVEPNGAIVVTLPRHGIGLFRLRPHVSTSDEGDDGFEDTEGDVGYGEGEEQVPMEVNLNLIVDRGRSDEATAEGGSGGGGGGTGKSGGGKSFIIPREEL